VDAILEKPGSGGDVIVQPGDTKTAKLAV